MCGITAIWKWSGEGFQVRALIDAVRSQAHRGPDGQGVAVWAEPNQPPSVWRGLNQQYPRLQPTTAKVGLGHNWLAIQDLNDEARQPLTLGSGRYWIVFNGEIYNFPELRARLTAAGQHFRTVSDTEVLLALWKRYGRDCLGLLRGMFAFVVYDRVEERMWAVRDRFGIKPLYFALLPGGAGILLASEIRGIHASGLISHRLDESATRAFLACGINKPSETETLFEDIRELPPGRFLEIRAGEITERTYYRLAPPGGFDLSEDEAISELRDRFMESVGLHVRSNRRVGFCLSGGLDSTNIAFAAARSRSAEEMTAFSFGNPESPDLALANLAARHLPFRQAVFSPPEKVSLEDLTDMIRACELPNHTWGPINQFWLMRRIQSETGVPVLLSGQGGDEVFSGYPWFFPLLHRRYAEYASPEAAAELLAAFQSKAPLPPVPLIAACRMYLSPPAWLEIHGDGALGALGTDAPEVLDWEAVNFYLNDEVDWSEFRERTFYRRELQHLLRQEDRLGMRFSIEARTPFLDHQLVEFIGEIPPEVLVSKGFLKFPLRVLFPEIPPEIRFSTRKFGFWENHATVEPRLLETMRSVCLDSGRLRDFVGDRRAFERLGSFALWRFFQIAILGEPSRGIEPSFASAPLVLTPETVRAARAGNPQGERHEHFHDVV